MSYCRFSEADVYVYTNVGGWIECCACELSEDCSHHFSTDSIIAHLREHVAAGHDVPDRVFADLEADRSQNDEFISEDAR